VSWLIGSSVLVSRTEEGTSCDKPFLVFLYFLVACDALEGVWFELSGGPPPPLELDLAGLMIEAMVRMMEAI